MNKKANAITGFLFFIMACIIIALFMPVLMEFLNPPDIVCNFTNGTIICLIIHFYPIALLVVLLIIFLFVMRG